MIKSGNTITSKINPWIIAVILMVAMLGGMVDVVYAETKLIASDGAGGDRFGRSVMISGNWAIIGAPDDDGTSGSAYIFQYDGANWVEQTKLTASDGVVGDHFGDAVSISNDLAIVGAYGDDAQTGSAYIFQYDGANWVEQTKLTASDGEDYDTFGFSVSILGNRAIIGALNDSDIVIGSFHGSVYVFQYDGTNWVEQTKLIPSDITASDMFGCSVSISGNHVIVGAYQDNVFGMRSGSAYIFQYDGTNWVEQTKLIPNNGEAEDMFGIIVSISGNRSIVGSHGSNGLADDSGAAYIFQYDGTNWVEQTKLTASDGATGDSFGRFVSISGDRTIIGAYNYLETSPGSAYIFQFDGTNWVEQTKLTASDGANNDWFGWSVSISGDQAIIGASGDDDLGLYSGSTYIFHYNGNGSITPTPDNSTPKQGDMVCIQMDVVNVADLYAADFDMIYDPAVLDYQYTTEGECLNQDGESTAVQSALLDGTSGTVVEGISRLGDVAGVACPDAVLATVCFNVIGDYCSSTNIDFVNAVMEGPSQGSEIPAQWNQTTITISLPAPTNPTIADPGLHNQIDLSWDVVSGTDEYDIYRSNNSGGSFELIGTTTATSYSDTDCIITTMDYYYKVRAVSGGTCLSEFSAEVSGIADGLLGDINIDNRADGRDLSRLARAFGSSDGNVRFDCQADLDRTNLIDGDDLSLLATNFGQTL